MFDSEHQQLAEMAKRLTTSSGKLYLMIWEPSESEEVHGYDKSVSCAFFLGQAVVSQHAGVPGVGQASATRHQHLESIQACTTAPFADFHVCIRV